MADITVRIGTEKETKEAFLSQNPSSSPPQGQTQLCGNTGENYTRFGEEIVWMECAEGPIQGSFVLFQRTRGQLDLAEVEVKVTKCQEEK